MKALLHGGIGRGAILLALIGMAALITFFAFSLPTRAQSAQFDPALPSWWPGAAAIAAYPKCKPNFDSIRTIWRSEDGYYGGGEHCQITMFTGNSEFMKAEKKDYDTSIAIGAALPFEREAQSWAKKYNHLRVTMYIYTKHRKGTDANIDALGSGFENIDRMRWAGNGWNHRPLVENSAGLCPAALAISKDIAKFIDPRQVTDGGFVYKCRALNSRASTDGYTLLDVYIETAFPRKQIAEAPVKAGACTTDVLKGPWRAENAALAKTGHAVTFAAAPNVPKHDGGQVAQRGAFSTYPAHKNLLQLLPNPLFTSARGYPAGKDQCLIPVVSQRDSGTSRSAVLIDTKASTLRFVTENAYQWTGKAYQLNAVIDNLVGGLEGRWLRGAAPALAKTCTPADFNGRWDRSDGARVTIRGAGTQGVGGTGSMDDHPENWVRGQNKYTSMRMKSACVYTAKCYASQRTTINGRPDFKMVETACELVIDPETKTLRERGTSNSYTYTKAGGGAAARQPPSAVTPPEPAQPSQEVQSLNSQQAAAAKREIQAYEARKKAIADEQAAKEAAYRKALADREALIAENNRRAAEARAKWEASAAACRAGDQSQCAPKP
jgi:hypothetical protein